MQQDTAHHTRPRAVLSQRKQIHRRQGMGIMMSLAFFHPRVKQEVRTSSRHSHKKCRNGGEKKPCYIFYGAGYRASSSCCSLIKENDFLTIARVSFSRLR